MKKILLIVIAIILVLILAFFVRLFFLGKQSQEMQVQSSLIKSGLKPCGEKPNCVSSYHLPDSEHFIAAIRVQPIKLSYIPSILTDMNCKIETAKKDYWHTTCKTGIMGFVDDFELLYRPQTSFLYFRSQSRVGHSDLGANRKRVEVFKEMLSLIK